MVSSGCGEFREGSEVRMRSAGCLLFRSLVDPDGYKIEGGNGTGNDEHCGPSSGARR